MPPFTNGSITIKAQHLVDTQKSIFGYHGDILGYHEAPASTGAEHSPELPVIIDNVA
jgi:hypothetical protein